MDTVLVLTASPRRNGNSTILARRAAEGVNSAGGKADIVSIGGLKIAPCSACDACRGKRSSGCIIKDDMEPLYGRIADARGIIFATPIYWFNVSAQMKLVIDRTYAMTRDGSYGLTGKNVGVILTYADEDVFVSGAVNALRSFQDTFAYVKANLIGSVYGSADKAGEAQMNERLLQKAYELGKKVALANS